MCAVLVACRSCDPLQLLQFSGSGGPLPFPQPSFPTRPLLSDQPLPSATPPPPKDAENSMSNSGDFGLTLPANDLTSFHEEPVLEAAVATTHTAWDHIYANSSLSNLCSICLWASPNGSGTKLQFTCNSTVPPCPLQPLTLLSFQFLNWSLCYPLSLLLCTLLHTWTPVITSILLLLLLLQFPFLTLSTSLCRYAPLNLTFFKKI